MKRLLVVAGIVALSLAGQTAQAQQPIGQSGVPNILQLRQYGTNPALQYYNVIQPINAYRGAINQIQQNAQGIENREFTTGSIGTAQTGHTSGFQTHLKYFGNVGGARAAGGAGGAIGGGLTNPLGAQAGNNQAAGARTVSGPTAPTAPTAPR